MSLFLVACPWLTEKTTCPHFVFEDTTLGFSIKLEMSFSPFLGIYVPSFDLRHLVTLYHISEYYITVKRTMNINTSRTMCPVS